MKLFLPNRVCDAHVTVGEFPRLKVTFTIADLKKIMEKYQIKSVLAFSGYLNAEENTRRLLKTCERDRRFYVLLRAHPTKYMQPEYVSYMEKLLQNNSNVVGVKINSSTEKHKPTSHIYRKLLKMLNDNSAVLLLHCGRWVEMSGWHYAIEVAKKHPDITVIMAHMGGTHPDLSFPAIKAAKNLSNVYMDTSQTRQIQVVKKGITELGMSRILFGSDMPWGDYAQNLVGITELNLKEKTLGKLLRRNFNNIVGGKNE